MIGRWTHRADTCERQATSYYDGNAPLVRDLRAMADAYRLCAAEATQLLNAHLRALVDAHRHCADEATQLLEKMHAPVDTDRRIPHLFDPARAAWLKNLKPGDSVLSCDLFTRKPARVDIVDAVRIYYTSATLRDWVFAAGGAALIGTSNVRWIEEVPDGRA